MARAEARGLVVVADRDAATRLLIGSMLTYVVSDGLFAPAGALQPPSAERLAAFVRLFLRAVAPAEAEAGP